MLKSIVLFASGCIGGGIAVYLAVANGFLGATTGLERDLLDDANIEISEVDLLRAEQFASVTSIEDVLSLPTDHSETEALYALAGRSSSGQLQFLFEQANRIAERGERLATQKVLLARLAELDPLSALAIARQADATDVAELSSAAWSAWAGSDFDAAMAAAMDLETEERRLAAEALYIVVGLESEEADRLEDQFGFPPGQEAVSAHLERLAVESPLDAVAFLESLAGPFNGMTLIESLARAVAKRPVNEHASVAGAFEVSVNRQVFDQFLSLYKYPGDPEAVLRQVLADQSAAGWERQNEIAMAVTTLAREDLDLATHYVSQIESRRARQAAQSTIATIVAVEDPDRALDWMREQNLSFDSSAYISVLSTIARKDLQRAVSIAQSLPDPAVRQRNLSMIGMQIADYHPTQLSEALDSVDDAESRRTLIRSLSSSLAQRDHKAAVSWAKSLESSERDYALQEVVSRLLQMDVSGAMSAVEVMPEERQKNYRPQIAAQLAEQQSIEAAQLYIAQYEGEDDYAKMQAALVGALVRRDPLNAQHHIASVPDQRLKDQLRAMVVRSLATSDSDQAFRMLNQISDPAARKQALSGLSSAMFSTDPAAAETWLRGLPPGDERDWAASAAATRKGLPADQFMVYVGMIGDTEMRKSAELSYVFQLAQSDRQAALAMFEKIDLSEGERARYEQMIDRVGGASLTLR